MPIFISYTRKTEEISDFASKLFGRLKLAGYEVFYDKEGIQPREVWTGAIEREIGKADLFIILFSKEGIATGDYFAAELEDIKKSCEDRIQNICVIPVLFGSITVSELPQFFQHYHAISEPDNKRELKITKIKNAIKGWQKEKEERELKKKEQEQKNKKNEQKENISKLLLAISALTLTLMAYFIGRASPSDPVNSSMPITSPSVSVSPSMQITCDSLEGKKYTLHQRYIFKDNDHYRIVVNKTNSSGLAGNFTSWKVKKCEDKVDSITITGEDNTYFDIESILEGKFETIAKVLYSYFSDVAFNKKSNSWERNFHHSEQTYINGSNQLKNPEELELNEKLEYPLKNMEGGPLGISQEDRRKKVETAIKELNTTFIHRQPHSCHVMTGQIDSKSAFAFICSKHHPGYIRLMVEQ